MQASSLTQRILFVAALVAAVGFVGIQSVFALSPAEVGIQAADCRGRGGAYSQGSVELRGAGGGWTAWASNRGWYDPDCARVFLGSPSGGHDVRMCIQIVDHGTRSQLGVERCTPWATDGGGVSAWAHDTNVYDPDSLRVKFEQRAVPAGKTMEDIRIGLQVSDRGCRAQVGAVRYTPWLSQGGGWSDWAADANRYDPDCFRVYLGVQNDPSNDSDQDDPNDTDDDAEEDEDMNHAPLSPTVQPLNNACRVGIPFGLRISATDPDGDKVRYFIDWDADGNVDIIAPSLHGYVPSGTALTVSHTYTGIGEKRLRVFTQDEQGMSSPVATYVFNCGDELMQGDDDDTIITLDDEVAAFVGDALIDMRVAPALVREGKTTTLSWNIANVDVCTVTSTAGDVWENITLSSEGITSGKITERTSFTLSCLDLFGETVEDTATVHIVPNFEEF